MKTDAGKRVFEPFDLPVFEKPQIEWWPSKMTWDEAMRAFEPQRKEYMRLTIRPKTAFATRIPSRSAWTNSPHATKNWLTPLDGSTLTLPVMEP